MFFGRRSQGLFGGPCLFIESMRTIVYVDEFNLYYRALKTSLSGGWIFRYCLGRCYGENHDIELVRYFTARVKHTSKNPSQAQRQDIYLKALQKYRSNVEIHFGSFLTHRIRRPLANSKEKQKMVWVLDTKEKSSDVNLAVHLLNDAWLGKCDCAILVSNDSDIAEAMRLVKQQHPKILLGLVTPGSGKRSDKLKRYADFTLRIRESTLNDSQLPNPIPRTNIYKPKSW